jgi:hypothetical protein
MGRVKTALQVMLVMICASFLMWVDVFVSAESVLDPDSSRSEKWCSPPSATSPPASSSSPVYSSPSPSSSSSSPVSPSSPSSPTNSPSPTSSSSPVSSSPSSPSYSSPTYSPTPTSASPVSSSPSSPSYNSPTYSSPSPSSSSPVSASPRSPSYSSPTYSPSPTSSSSPVSASPSSPSYSSPTYSPPSGPSSSSPANGSPSSGSSPVTPSSSPTFPGPAAAPLPSSPSTTYPTTPSSPNCPPLASWFTSPDAGSPSWWDDQLAAEDRQQAVPTVAAGMKNKNTAREAQQGSNADTLVGQEKLGIPDFAGSPLTPLIPGPASSAEPGTCTYWSSHTSSIPSILEGTIASLISLFDIATGTTQLPFASGTTLVQGLTNTRPDAYGALMRQGSAALINSYHFSNFAYTPQQVRESFNGALYSEQAAAVQAVQFENANRGYDVRNMAP